MERFKLINIPKITSGMYLNIFMCITALLPILLSFNSALHGDSAYYLLIVERINEGYIPYKTVALAYTPLWFYLMFFINYIYNAGFNYEFFLVIHYVFVFLCAFFIFKIVKIIIDSKQYAFIAAWLFVIISHWLQGNIILLEIPSVTFGLIASYLVLKYKDSIYLYFFIGTLAVCSFLTKQFGVGFYFLNLYLIFFNEKRWKQFWLYNIGYFIPLLICFLIWKENFLPIIFSKHGTQTAIDAGRELTFSSMVTSWTSSFFGFFFFRIFPNLIFIIVFIPQIVKFKKFSKELLFCLFGIVGYSFQFLLVQGLHYCLYLVPFAIILSTIILTLKANKWQAYLYLVAFVLTISLSLYSTYINRVYKQYIVSNQKQEQVQLAQIVKNNTNMNDKLWIAHGGLFYIYYYTNLMPPNLATIGYSFGPLGINEKQAFQQARDADVILKFEKDYPYDSFLTDSLKQFISGNEYKEIQNGILLYRMKN